MIDLSGPRAFRTSVPVSRSRRLLALGASVFAALIAAGLGYGHALNSQMYSCAVENKALLFPGVPLTDALLAIHLALLPIAALAAISAVFAIPRRWLAIAMLTYVACFALTFEVDSAVRGIDQCDRLID